MVLVLLACQSDTQQSMLSQRMYPHTVTAWQQAIILSGTCLLLVFEQGLKPMCKSLPATQTSSTLPYTPGHDTCY